MLSNLDMIITTKEKEPLKARQSVVVRENVNR